MMEQAQAQEYFKSELLSEKVFADNGFIDSEYIIYLHQASLGNFEHAEDLIGDYMPMEISRFLMKEANYSSLAIFNHLSNAGAWFAPDNHWALNGYICCQEEDIGLFDILIERMDLDDYYLEIICEHIGVDYFLNNNLRGIELLKLAFYLGKCEKTHLIEYVCLLKKWKPDWDLRVDLLKIFNFYNMTLEDD